MATEQETQRGPVLIISSRGQNPDRGMLNLRNPRTTQVITLTPPGAPKKLDLLNWAVRPDSTTARIVENDDHDQHQHGHHGHDHQHDDGDGRLDLILGQGLKPLGRFPKVELSPNKELGLWDRSIQVIVDAALNLKLAPDLNPEDREILEDTARYRAGFAADPRNIQPAEQSFNRESDLAILSQLKKRGSSLSNLTPVETAEALLLMRSTLFGQNERDNLAKSLKHFDSEDFLHQGTISEIQPSLNYQVTVGHERAIFAYSQILQVIALSMALEAQAGPISKPADQIIIQLSSFFQEFGFALSNLRDGNHFAILNPDQNLQDLEQALAAGDLKKIASFSRKLAHGGPEKVNGFHGELKRGPSGFSMEFHSHGVTEQLQKANQVNEQASSRSRVNLVFPNQLARAPQRPPSTHLGPIPIRPHLQSEAFLPQKASASWVKESAIINPTKLVTSFSVSLNTETFRARPTRGNYLKIPLHPLIEVINFSKESSILKHLPLLPNREVARARKRENPSNPDTDSVDGIQKPTAGDLRNQISQGKEDFLAKVANPDLALPKAKREIVPAVADQAISEKTLATSVTLVEERPSANKSPQLISAVIQEVSHPSKVISKADSNPPDKTPSKPTFPHVDSPSTPWVNTEPVPQAVETRIDQITVRDNGETLTGEIYPPSTTSSALRVTGAPISVSTPKQPDFDLKLPQGRVDQKATSMSSLAVEIGTSLADALRQMETTGPQSEVVKNTRGERASQPSEAANQATQDKTVGGETNAVIKEEGESVSEIATLQQNLLSELGTNEMQQQKPGTPHLNAQNQNNSTQGSKVTPHVMAAQQNAFALAVNPGNSGKLSEDPVEIGDAFRRAYLEAQESHRFAA